MTDHACVGSRSSVRFRDPAGRNIMVFVRLCDGTYFGGRTHDDVPFTSSGQMRASVGVLFNLIARLANEDQGGMHYAMDGNDWSAIIQTEMQAHDIAKVLGCPVEEVTRHFSFLIKIAAPEAANVTG